MGGQRKEAKRRVETYDSDGELSSGNEVHSDQGEEDYVAPTKSTRKRKATKENNNSSAKNKRALMEEMFDEYDSEDPDLNEPGELKSNFEAGIIKKIDVSNFMCHKRFTIELGAHLNFITGKNGSGKSAIATAIQLCLGATARTTGRGTTLSTFIREGSDRPAIVKVTLSNRGPDAYQPEKYGKEITIERTITKGSGTPGYVMYDCHGKEVSRQRSDLEAMLKNFNIYVDNPCCVLTQEESKKFINGKDEDKYEFFLKATGLYNLREEVKIIIEDVEKAAIQRDAGEKKLAGKKENVAELKRLFDRFLRMDKLEQKIKICKGKLSWMDYYQAYEELEQIQKAVELKTQKVAKAQKLLEDNGGGEDQTQEKIKEIDLKISDIESNLKAVDMEIANCVQEERNSIKTTQSLKNQYNDHKQTLKQYQQDQKKLIEDIAVLQQKALEGAQAGERQALERREQVMNRIETYQEEEQRLKLERLELITQKQEAASNQARLQGAINSLRHQMSALQGEIQTLSDSNQNKAAMLGRYMAPLLQRMSRHNFRGPVFGPIGVCVKLNEGYDKWSRALERALGAQLRSFVVTCSEDRKAIYDLARDLPGGNSVTIVTQPNLPRYQVSMIEQPDVVSVLQAITINDDLVFNCLVDQLGIERTILVEREEDVVRRHVQQTRGLDELKYHASAAITIDGTLVRYTNGNQSSEVNRYQHINILAKDKQALIQTAQTNLQQKGQELQTVEEEFRHFQQLQRPIDQQAQQKEQRLNTIAQEIRKLLREKQQIELEINEVKAATSIDFTPYEAEKEERRLAMEQMQEQIQDMMNRLEHQEKEAQQLRRAKETLTTKRKGFEVEINKLAEESTQLITAQQRNRRALEQYTKNVQTFQEELQQEETRFTQKQVLVTAKEQEAIAFCQETIGEQWTRELTAVTAQDTRDKINRQIKELRAEMLVSQQQNAEKGYTLELVQQRYERAKEDLDKIETMLTNLSNNIELMNNSLDERKQKWLQLYRTTTNMTKQKFDCYVQAKGSSGTIKFDGKAEKVQLTYQVDNADKNSVANDVRNLSGGERSFVTFCLQLALGHVIECPFRLLDEYDIFMDEVTRKLTLDTLQEYTRLPEQRQRQFIILTPHKLSDITPSKFVRVQKMKEPERYSAAGLQQQTLD